MRVVCEFGRRKIVGLAIEVSEQPPPGLEPSRVKPLLAVLDSEPAIPRELLTFLQALAAYYVAPVGEVMRMALPALERSQANERETQALLEQARVTTVGRLVQAVHLTDRGTAACVEKEFMWPRGQAKAVAMTLAERGELSIAELEETHPSARAAVRRLIELQLAEMRQVSRKRDPFAEQRLERDQPKALNQAQRKAVDALVDALDAETRRPALLQGVTGSGKTEVYLHVVDACLKRQLGCIVLVPEIALTPQLVNRFRARFGDIIAVLHSGLSEVDRQQMWKRLRSGELLIAVGARSALFAPVSRLGLICVDEEHDGSFKQEEGVRYHARDMALLRAHRSNALCLLGSATPSLQTEALVERGQLSRLVLPERAIEGAVLPNVEVVNLRSVGPGPSGNKLLTLPLHRALQHTLESGKQAILFLNRRGFAPSVVCDACGTVVECPNCSVALTVHRSAGEHVRCHYCDHVEPMTQECAQCHSRQLTQEGVGTERIEVALQEAFPTARIGRLDRDVASGLKSERILNAMQKRELDILVGTQMVTKGHDLPDVALVGVLNADAALSMPDYQASERTFQLLVQVAGRAGRSKEPGMVLIQTRNPEHPAVRYAVAHDVRGFAQQELHDRREASYPPFVRMLMIRIDALEEKLALNEAEKLARFAEKIAGSRAEVSPPSPAPIARLRNRYRFRCVLRATERRPLFDVARAIQQLKIDKRVRVNVDMDPMNML